MAARSDQQRTRVLALLQEGRLDRDTIASEVGVSLGTVSAMKAHMTMGSYGAVDAPSSAPRAAAGSDVQRHRVASKLQPPAKSGRDPGMPVVCGVDGCRDGWVVVSHDLASGRLWWGLAPTIGSIVAATSAPAVVAIHVPIGLLDVGSRQCDQGVRRLLGERGSSVFAAPIRPLLDAASWAQANAIRRTVEGKGLSVQTWAIVPKIREADEALRADPALLGVVCETHPELCFSFMNDGRPMTHGKKKADGKAQRIAVLRARFGDVIDDALATRPQGCVTDDLLDAFAAVWTAARVARGEAVTVPAKSPRDRFGLPMEMVV